MRTLRLFGVLLCTLFAINVPVAWATTASATADCDAVTFNYIQFPLTTVDVTEVVKIDGVVVVNQTTPITKPAGWGSAPLPHNVPIAPGPGAHVVDWKASFYDPTHLRNKTFRGTININCEPICTRGAPNPAGAHASGEAFGAYVNVSELIKLKPRPKVTSFQSGVGTSGDSDELLTAQLPNVLKLVALGVSSNASVTEDPAEARDLSTSEVANLNLLKGMITASVIRASAEAIADGDSSAYSAAGSTFQNLKINGVRYENVAPNTIVKLPKIPGLIGKGSYVVLYEHLASSSAPPAGTLAGGTYSADLEVNMIHVVVKSPLGLPDDTEITVAHAASHADFPQVKMCPGDNDGNTVSGHAFSGSLTMAPTPDYAGGGAFNAVRIEPTGGEAYVEFASGIIPGPPQVGNVMEAAGGQSYSKGTVGSDSTDATSYANIADVNLLGGQIKAKVIKSQCASSANADGGTSNADGTLFLGLEIAGQAQAGNAPPNTTIPLGPLGYVVLNEQVPDAEADGHTGITIRALHVVVAPLGLDLRVAEAHCDATFN